MPTPAQEAEIAQTLAAVAVVAEAGAASIGIVSWANHDQLVNSILDATSLYYLRTDPRTGEVSDAMVPVDFGRELFNFGCFRETVEPLVSHLEAIVAMLEAQELDGQEAIDLGNLRARMDRYRSSLEGAPMVGPDLGVWLNVTAPLLLGLYPANFVNFGISDPSIRSAPDVVRPYTLSFQTSLLAVADRQVWQVFAADLLARSVGVVTWLVELPGKAVDAVVDGARAAARGGKQVLLVAAAAAGIAGIFALSRKG